MGLKKNFSFFVAISKVINTFEFGRDEKSELMNQNRYFEIEDWDI